jgi:competence ComEA-like helix-hairpin-helix protein
MCSTVLYVVTTYNQTRFKMKTRFINYFHFSRNERLGAFALLTFCAAIFITPAVLQQWRPRTSTDFTEFEATMRAFRQAEGGAETGPAETFDFDPNLATKEDFVRLGLSEKVAQNICNYRDKGGEFRKPEDFQKIWSLQPKDYTRLLPYIHISVGKKEGGASNHSPETPEYFPFDPNTATEHDFYRLGLNDRTIKGILNYRSKGGVFRKKEDFAKIYSLPEADYKRLEPYISIAAQTNTSANANWPEYNKKPASKGPVDINSAGVNDWMTLPLVGEKRAQQIVAFREKLGGFRAIEQLAEMYNLPDSVFQRIRPQLVLETRATHKINLNTASVEALDAHPYISRKQADLIVAYRSQHGQFSKAEDILNIKAFTDKLWWERVSPYLGVE